MSDIQDLFNQTRETWLDGARSTARRLLRDKLTITSEEVTKEWPLPTYLHHNLIGSVFQDKQFQAVGYTTAKRPVANGRVIRTWSLRDDRSDR